MKKIATILSIQISKPKTYGDKTSKDFFKKEYSTAGFKSPQNEAVTVTKLSIDGDEVADKKNHGGINKAVFANSFNNYKQWQEFLGLESLNYGALGENLTIDTIDEKDVCIGDIHLIGSVRLQVVQPRQPCWKISRLTSNIDMYQHIKSTLRTGWYYKILEEGTFKAGDIVFLVKQENEKVSIYQANEILKDITLYPKKVQYLLGLDILAKEWKTKLASKLKKI